MPVASIRQRAVDHSQESNPPQILASTPTRIGHGRWIQSVSENSYKTAIHLPQVPSAAICAVSRSRSSS